MCHANHARTSSRLRHIGVSSPGPVSRPDDLGIEHRDHALEVASAEGLAHAVGHGHDAQLRTSLYRVSRCTGITRLPDEADELLDLLLGFRRRPGGVEDLLAHDRALDVVRAKVEAAAASGMPIMIQ